MANVVIFGAGDIARLAHYYFTHDSPHDVAAFVVDREFRQGHEFLGLPLTDWEDAPAAYPPGDFMLFVALSYARMNGLRADKYLAAKAAGIGQRRGADQIVQRGARAEQLHELRLQLIGRRFLHPGHQRLEPAKRQLARLFVGPGGRKTAIHCQGVAHAGNEHASSHVLEELSAAVAVHERTP